MPIFNALYSALWFISKNEEALFILLFWKVGPSCDHNTPLKCVLYIWKAVYKVSTSQTSLRRIYN